MASVISRLEKRAEKRKGREEWWEEGGRETKMVARVPVLVTVLTGCEEWSC